MIVIFQNNKLIAADKKLLDLLDTNLINLSNVISSIQMGINALTKNSININSKNFSVNEISVITLKELKIYSLKEISDKEPKIENELETFLKTEPIAKPSEEFLEINKEPEELLEKPKNLFNEPVISKQNEQFNDLQSTLNQESTVLPPKKLENEEITLTFNDEFEEVNNILSLDTKEAKELLEKDLQKASQDLGIDINTLHELFHTLLNQIDENKDKFYNELKNSDYENLHKTAHLLKGAALNLRLSNIALILKTIDEESKKNTLIEKIKYLIDNFYKFIDRIKDNKKSTTTKPKSKKDIPEYIKELIIQTIKDYLATQNEKRFKKDLKYIEKLLNIKISSVKELENLVKS